MGKTASNTTDYLKTKLHIRKQKLGMLKAISHLFEIAHPYFKNGK